MTDMPSEGEIRANARQARRELKLVSAACEAIAQKAIENLLTTAPGEDAKRIEFIAVANIARSMPQRLRDHLDNEKHFDATNRQES